MRLSTVVSCVAIALLAGACGKEPSNVGGPGGGAVFPSIAMLDLGKRQQFHSIVPDTRLVWSLPDGVDAGFISRSGMYYAPLRPPPNSTVRVLASVGTFTGEASVQLSTRPPDPGDCLGEGQSDAPGGFVYIEELPEAIVMVPPIYPDLAREAGVDGTVMVQAHVCACGEIDSTSIVKSVPMLDEAASAAVRQWIFKPALSNGEPQAVWVGVPVKFSLH